MITHVSLVTLWVRDQDAAKRFWIEIMGFEERTDTSMGEGFRWVTVGSPRQPELQVTLMVPGPPLDDAQAAGTMPGFGLDVDDCHAEYGEPEVTIEQVVQSGSAGRKSRGSTRTSQLPDSSAPSASSSACSRWAGWKDVDGPECCPGEFSCRVHARFGTVAC